MKSTENPLSLTRQSVWGRSHISKLHNLQSLTYHQRARGAKKANRFPRCPQDAKNLSTSWLIKPVIFKV